MPTLDEKLLSCCASQFSPLHLSDSNEATSLTIESHLELQLLAAYHHGRLTESELAEVVSHLSRCRKCREILAELVRSEDSVPNDNGNRKQ